MFPVIISNDPITKALQHFTEEWKECTKQTYLEGNNVSVSDTFLSLKCSIHEDPLEIWEILAVPDKTVEICVLSCFNLCFIALI